jgi:hypothetical protein
LGKYRGKLYIIGKRNHKILCNEEDVTNKKVLENQREELVKNLAVSNEELEDYAHVVPMT